MSSTPGSDIPEAIEAAGGSSPPERAARLSDLPPNAGAERLATHMLDDGDRAFLKALRDAGLAPDLAGEELLRVATIASEGEGLRKRIDLLDAYYLAGADTQLSRTRRQLDRFLLQHESDGATAGTLIDRLAEIAPELKQISLERVGGSDEGPLVLRAGEHMAALLDEVEENLDTDEIDLRDLEERRRKGITMVTLRSLVRATNVLLDRHGVRERLVPVRSDLTREVYVGLPLTEAIELTRAACLEEDDPEAIMELASW